VSALTAGRPAPAVPQPLSATDSAVLAAAEAAASTLRLLLNFCPSVLKLGTGPDYHGQISGGPRR
jgi:hypothetical protein